jgi:hypothetical protein
MNAAQRALEAWAGYESEDRAIRDSKPFDFGTIISDGLQRRATPAELAGSYVKHHGCAALALGAMVEGWYANGARAGSLDDAIMWFRQALQYDVTERRDEENRQVNIQA